MGIHFKSIAHGIHTFGLLYLELYDISLTVEWSTVSDMKSRTQKTHDRVQAME